MKCSTGSVERVVRQIAPGNPMDRRIEMRAGMLAEVRLFQYQPGPRAS